MIFRINSDREVCWDLMLADVIDNASLNMHKPVRKNIALSCNAPWEGEHCCYASLIKDGDKFRMYYRGSGYNDGPGKYDSEIHYCICMAESADGKTFTKPNLGIYEYNGSKENNIIFTDNRKIDNFSVYLDENPNCPHDSKYKALTTYFLTDEKRYLLHYYKSADGLHFEFVCNVPVNGTFDTLNIALWDNNIKKYRIYIRGFHNKPDPNNPDSPGIRTRDIRMCESDDFINWSDAKIIEFTDNKEDLQLYTNGITKYPRSNIYYGMPVRYMDRAEDAVNYKYLPDLHGQREPLIRLYGRGGTAITDAGVMTSRDGFRFDRTDEVFLSPGIENGENWVYGDCYIGRGMLETESDYPDEPCELSIYTGKGYRSRPVDFIRYTLRMDGLFSWGAKYDGGSILTHPIIFTGDSLSINFETSAIGHIQIKLCDINGQPIEGYSSGRIFGNSINRPIEFEKPLSELSGKEIRILFIFKDAELYSFIFN